MIVSTVLAASALLATIASAAPAGSKHTVYLATCAPDDCPIDLCDPSDYNLVAAAYFENGPPTSASSSASAIGTLSKFTGGSSWEGTSKSVRIGIKGTFTANIPTTAKTAAKGDLVGDASLVNSGLLGIGASTEPFVCFKDGSTKFKATYELDRYTCTASYYCPSIDAGSS